MGEDDGGLPQGMGRQFGESQIGARNRAGPENCQSSHAGNRPGDLTEEQAVTLGIPVREGIRLDGLVDGMGAQRCGLQVNDVIVEMAGHPIRNDASSLPNAIVGKKGGDKIEVVYYADPKRKTS